MKKQAKEIQPTHRRISLPLLDLKRTLSYVLIASPRFPSFSKHCPMAIHIRASYGLAAGGMEGVGFGRGGWMLENIHLGSLGVLNQRVNTTTTSSSVITINTPNSNSNSNDNTTTTNITTRHNETGLHQHAPRLRN